MSDTATRTRRRAKDTASSAEDEGRDVTKRDEDEDSMSNGHTITSELKDTFREAAIEVLKPVMRKATTAAAKYAVKEGPSLVKDKLAPRLEDAGGAAGIAKGLTSKGGGVAEAVGGVASKLTGKGGGKSPSGTGRGRRLPVEEFVDVGVDIETAYNQFTQFEDWPKFMHRVERIEQRDDTTLMWHENIWGVRRSWEAEITKQIPCERLVWRSKNGPQTIGVVTFHRLSDNLTRVMITMDFQPKGLFEKTSSGTRISRRALVSDLMRFKAFLELRDEATGGWEGRIEDGEVVDDQGAEDEQEPRAEDEEDFEDEDVEADEDEEPEAAEDEEPEAAEDEEPEAEAEAEDEDEDEEPEAAEDEEPEAEAEDEEPEAAEDEDFDEEEEPEGEEEEEEPRSRRNGRRRRKVEEEDLEEAPKPRRRRRAAEEAPKAKPRRRRSATKA